MSLDDAVDELLLATQLLNEGLLFRGLPRVYIERGSSNSRYFTFLDKNPISGMNVPPPEATSASLLERIRLGTSSESWYEFVTLYNRLIERWLLRQGVRGDDAEDIRQEVMVVVLKEVQGFQHNGRTGAFRNWLRTITANRLREFWRARKRQQSTDAIDLELLAAQLDDATSDISRIWNEEHDQQMIEHLLLRISKQFKPESVSAFRQVVIEQRPIQQVSEEMQLTINAIRIAQSRILRALRRAGEGLIDQ